MLETILLVILLVCMLLQYPKKTHNFPPGPLSLPIIGNSYCIDFTNSQQSITQLFHQYGDYIGILVTNYKAVIINNWEPIREALANENCQGRPDVCVTRDRFQGDILGVIFTEGPSWRTQRRFALHHFRNLGFGRRNHEETIRNEAEQLTQEIEMKTGSPFVVHKNVVYSTINVMWYLIGGERYPHSHPTLEYILDNVHDTIQSLQIVGSVASVMPYIRYVFPNLTGYRQVKDSSKNLMEFSLKRIEEHEATLDTNNPRDFIDIYLTELKENGKELDESFSKHQLAGIIMDLLLAAGDTTSSVITFGIYFCCLYPEIQEKIYEEIIDNIGQDEIPSVANKSKLVFTEATVLEVMRQRPPGPTVIPHRTTQDTTLGSYSIPKGTILFCNITSILMDPKYWNDPEVFDPNRFISEDGKIFNTEKLIVFSKGKRSCLGEILARMSSFILLARMLQKFKFSFAKGEPIPPSEGLQYFTLVPPVFRVSATPRG